MPLESEPKLSMENVAMKEIHAFYKKNPEMTEDDAIDYCLNNIHTRLPSAEGRDLSEIQRAGKQKSMEELKEEKLPYFERFFKFKPMGLQKIETSKEEWVKEGWSEKYLDSTDLVFFRDVQDAIREVGVDIEVLESAVKNRYHKRSVEDARNIFLPIYIKLREKGYSHRDLGGI